MSPSGEWWMSVGLRGVMWIPGHIWSWVPFSGNKHYRPNVSFILGIFWGCNPPYIMVWVNYDHFGDFAKHHFWPLSPLLTEAGIWGYNAFLVTKLCFWPRNIDLTLMGYKSYRDTIFPYAQFHSDISRAPQDAGWRPSGPPPDPLATTRKELV